MDYHQFRERMQYRAFEREREVHRRQFRLILLFAAAGILLVISAIVGYLSSRS